MVEVNNKIGQGQATRLAWPKALQYGKTSYNETI